ncbi:hypothetical protein A5634_08165 [Mycobacterium asiaticum]|uniref:DSBA-like thioredoxin domain-containing protein n=1 Tax=Mycobacterium asiaticum TaxID=1790 RepID=A0A1A3NM44_MYCAS|nr:hypothetical protein [Mycobacterium asiaticum]OBK22134.1 hypothetical protein A5634_08165 [Mycobacterium asiaticum]
MTLEGDARREPNATLWLDPVCPFSWNTARWLRAVGEKTGIAVDWKLMSLAILNEGQELPPAQQTRMRDSRAVGRIMAALARDKGAAEWVNAYFVFGERYFDRSEPLSEELITHVLSEVGVANGVAAAKSDTSLDAVLLDSHQAGQDALGDSSGSPILRIDGQTFFGPVLTGSVDEQDTAAVFDAIATLAAAPVFAELQRPRERSS